MHKMTAKAERILDSFRVRGLHAGDFIHFTDFGDAIVWEADFVRDEPAPLVSFSLTTLLGKLEWFFRLLIGFFLFPRRTG
jgi:hypothetical protein